MGVDWAAVIAIVGAVAGLGSAYAAWRKIRPESTKLELEGRSTFIAAESGYFDRLTERLESENLRLGNEMASLRAETTALRARVALLEAVEQELSTIRTQRDAAVRSVAEERVKVEQLEQRVSALETELAALKGDTTP